MRKCLPLQITIPMLQFPTAYCMPSTELLRLTTISDLRHRPKIPDVGYVTPRSRPQGCIHSESSARERQVEIPRGTVDHGFFLLGQSGQAGGFD